MAPPSLQGSILEDAEVICVLGLPSSGSVDEEIGKEIDLKAFIIPKTDCMAVYITSQTHRVLFTDCSLQTALPHDRW